MEALKISPATEQDYPFLVEMLVLSFKSMPNLAAKPAVALEGMARLEIGQWQNGRDCAFVARQAGQQVGAVWVRGSGEVQARHFNLGLAVVPDFQRRGIGGGLLEQALAYCQPQRGHSVSLKVHPSNEAAIRLYKRMRFEVTMHEMKYKP